MDFGIFNLMGYREHGPTTREILREAAEQTCLCDQGGLGLAWFAEHHFSNYCVCPSPLMMAAYCAPLTKKIRLGAGVLVLPLYAPARLIAEVGMVDSLSEGRLVVGVGSGYQPFEFERFGKDLSKSKDMTVEFIDMIERGLTDEFIDQNSEYYRLPKSHISPRPHNGLPEIWIAGDSSQLHRLSARKGYPMITNGRFADSVTLGARRRDFEQAYLEEGLDAAKLRWGLLRFGCVTESKEDARLYAENARWQLRLAGATRRREEALEGHMLVATKPAPNEPSLEDILATQVIGDVDTCIERGIDEIRQTGAHHISYSFQLGNFPHAKAMRSIELFAERVIPGIEKELGPLSSYEWSPAERDRPLVSSRPQLAAAS